MHETPGHDVCIFAGGDVIETFSSPGHYAEYHYNSLEWRKSQYGNIRAGLPPLAWPGS